jgi:hypothetical protein
MWGGALIHTLDIKNITVFLCNFPSINPQGCLFIWATLQQPHLHYAKLLLIVNWKVKKVT